MNVDLEKLVLLQAIDTELRHFAAEAVAAPRSVQQAEELRAQADAALEAVRKKLADEGTIRRTCSSDAEDRRIKLVKLVRQLDSATSATQVSALEHEIGFLRDAVLKFEDEELASMERTETLEEQQTKAQQLLVLRERSLEQARTEAARRITEANARTAQHNAERLALRATIAESALSLYDRITKSRGSGLAEAREQQCCACRMMVRPQRWQQLTGREHEHELFACESCSRILFHDPRRDRPGAWPAGERFHAAQQLEAPR
ncbi:MAG: C4-type zinc ribbon domain-containing protein [Acidobacteriaceae bacterium]|nr:C4-type zinc ribbon domain-containing protein [Acidobacteriaceae bacterium]